MVERAAPRNHSSLITGLLIGTVMLAVSVLCYPVFADAIADIDAIVERANELQSLGKASEAELELRRAVGEATARLGAQSSATGGLCRRLAAMYLESNRLPEAERYLRRAIVIATGYGPVSSTAGGDFVDTQIYIADALQHPESISANFMTADVLTLYSDLFAKQGRFADSTRLLKQVVKTYEQASAGLAGSHLSSGGDGKELLAEALGKLGVSLSYQSNYNEAEIVLKRAIEVTKQAKGPYSVELVKAVRALAGLYRSQGRSSDAQSLDDEAEEIEKRAL